MPPARHLALHALKATILAVGIGACAAGRALTPFNRRVASVTHVGLDAARRARYRVTLPRR